MCRISWRSTRISIGSPATNAPPSVALGTPVARGKAVRLEKVPRPGKAAALGKAPRLGKVAGLGKVDAIAGARVVDATPAAIGKVDVIGKADAMAAETVIATAGRSTSRRSQRRFKPFRLQRRPSKRTDRNRHRLPLQQPRRPLLRHVVPPADQLTGRIRASATIAAAAGPAAAVIAAVDFRIRSTPTPPPLPPNRWRPATLPRTK
jgi:hypothetical protein